MKLIVVIPTYNEAQNIGQLIDLLFGLKIPNLEILIIDDHSPDGTASLVKARQKKDARIHLIERAGKMGLGTAYVMGFKYALNHGYEYIVQMDADFSHDPREILHFIQEIKNYDLVIGSRYIVGVNVVNWPLSRLLLSYSANWYTRIITRMPIKDGTGGYKCFRREVLAAINLDEIHSDGYSFQIEMNYKTWIKGFRIKELPIVFMDRIAGSSKMSKRIIREAAWIVWKLRLLHFFGKLK
jgi:dolichol-phosphate mannosyltransferase